MPSSKHLPILPESEFKNHLCSLVEFETRKMTSLFIERFKKATDEFIANKRIALSKEQSQESEGGIRLSEDHYLEYYAICKKIGEECNESIKPFSLVN